MEGREAPRERPPARALTPPDWMTRRPEAAPSHPIHFNSSPNHCLPTKTGHERGGGARESSIARSGRLKGVTGAGVRQLLPGPRRRRTSRTTGLDLWVNLARFDRAPASPSCQPPEVRAAERPSLSLGGSPATLGPRSCCRLQGSRVWSPPQGRK